MFGLHTDTSELVTYDVCTIDTLYYTLFITGGYCYIIYDIKIVILTSRWWRGKAIVNVVDSPCAGRPPRLQTPVGVMRWRTMIQGGKL